jgi:cyanophycinase-like exopeptidase
MTTHGPIALIGGLEHLDGCHAIDRRLISETGATRPNVVVVPAASSRRLMAATAVLARNYWRRLGASVTVGVPGDGFEERLAEAVDEADIIVLTGGHPNKLFSRLGASPLLDLIIQQWEAGTAISGSSAGAMCMFEHRLNLYPPNPLKRIQGFGVLAGFTAAPHFDRFRAQHWAPWVSRNLLRSAVLGLDEGTALVGRNGEFKVEGKRNVTIVRDGSAQVFPAGATVHLDLLQGSPGPVTVSLRAVPATAAVR